MRLLRRDRQGKFVLFDFDEDKIPRYAMLSHVPGAESEEVTFEGPRERDTGKHKPGYEKLEFCGKQVASDYLQYFWVDTCCIDESNSTELAYATNSMFRWLQNASKCYVYLSDVSTTDPNQSWEEAFQNSEWFRRAWTLQDLIAPASVEFFSLHGKRLGDKESLEEHIYETTGIAIKALRGAPLTDFGG